MPRKGKYLEDVKPNAEKDRLYKDWFHGKRKAVEVGKGGPIIVGPKEEPDFIRDRKRKFRISE